MNRKTCKNVAVIGAGLAGVEAANSIAKAGEGSDCPIKVDLFEMKPKKLTPAHSYKGFAELVCSNSLKAKRLGSAAGLLKEEMRLLGSITVPSAIETEIPAGGALAVDRKAFSDLVTRKIKEQKNINIVGKEILNIPTEDEYDAVIVATGPLTDGKLAESIEDISGDFLSFYDAAAPIVSFDSIDMDSAFFASRYGRDSEISDKESLGDYINCPMNKDEYEAFQKELLTAELAPLSEFDKPEDKKVYEGCMPIETLASRGLDTMRFGPMKPVGLTDPKTEKRPWAVVQLRSENKEGTMWGLVGFQTSLKFGEQKRIFGMIPALKNAEFLRYGVMHRNTFLNSPKLLNENYSFKTRPSLFFAGQITGVEGYMESAMSGILAGENAVRFLKGENPLVLPQETMMGALTHNMAHSPSGNYQPMGANFGVIPKLDEHIRDKKMRYEKLAERSLNVLKEYID